MKNQSPPRLPRWSYVLIAAGGLLTYFCAGFLSTGARFMEDLKSAIEDPGAFSAGNPELLAPFFLLLIPAVLGCFGTRELLRIVVRGRKNGDSMKVIATAIGGLLLAVLVYVVLALFSGGVSRR